LFIRVGKNINGAVVDESLFLTLNEGKRYNENGFGAGTDRVCLELPSPAGEDRRK
jgi:hypothetical protein